MLSALVQNTAVITAIVAALTWVLNKLVGLTAGWHERKHNRRIALLRFQTDVRLRAEGLAGLSDPAYASSMVATIRDHAGRIAPFRMYGSQITDTISQEQVDAHVDQRSTDAIYLIKKVVLLDRLVVAEYDKMQTEAFERLEAERQVLAFQNWVANAKSLLDAVTAFEAEANAWPKSMRLPRRRAAR